MCVVGGGIAGCSAALHLAERGYRVVLLEEHRVGWGASGRSGAQAMLGVAAGHAKLARLIGASDARRVWDMTRRGPRADARADRQAPHRLRLGRRPHAGGDEAAPRCARFAKRSKSCATKLDYASVRYMPLDEVRSIIRERALHRRRCTTRMRPSASAQLHAGARGSGGARSARRSSRALALVVAVDATRPIADVRIRTAHGEVRARYRGAVRQRLSRRHSRRRCASKIMAVAHVHRRDRAAGRGAGARSDQPTTPRSAT